MEERENLETVAFLVGVASLFTGLAVFTAAGLFCGFNTLLSIFLSMMTDVSHPTDRRCAYPFHFTNEYFNGYISIISI